ncbi:hypothetical protein [Arthrobacter alpinus]|uniref:hypothetical protein n=1 Tax=Arthrobacter alpinus TaxID=656366 RepID=UPI000781F835|nr:hypothetical protein [Arthrobacter alpinus]
MMEQHEITWTQRDYDCAQAVLARVVDLEVQLPILTDEALVALDGLNRDQMTALPWLDEHIEQKELACNVALRSLLTSGAAFPLVTGEDMQPSGLAANEEITGIMALRRTGERIVTAELQKDTGPVWFYGYIHGHVVLEELVDAAGAHTFMLAARSDFPARVMELANAAKLESADGEAITFALDDFEQHAGPVLDGALGVTSITGVSLDEATFANYTLYSKPDHLVSLTSRVDGESVYVDLTCVAAATAHDAIAELVEKGLQ